MTTIKTIGLVVLGVIVSVLFSVTMNEGEDLQGVYNQVQKYFDDGIKVGSNGSTNGEMIAGSCSIAVNRSVSATSTATVDCAVTGVTSGDIVLVQASTTAETGAPFVISGAKASTTATGYITLSVSNMTGATANVPTNIASGTSYWVVDTN